MPAFGNMTVLKKDGTTNIVYTGVQAAQGEGSPAIWKSKTVGTAPAHQPEFRMSSRDADKGAKRALRSTFVYPQIATNTTTGVTSVVGMAMASADWTIPKGMAQTDIDEFAHQFANLLKAQVAAVQEGYAAA